MGFAELRKARDGTEYYRARYKVRRGRYGTVCDDQGRTIRYGRKTDAEKAANREEAKVDQGGHVDARRGNMTLTEWAKIWLPAQKISRGTRDQYTSLISVHVLAKWGDYTLNQLQDRDDEIEAWEQQMIADGAAPSTAGQARDRLSGMLGDAADPNRPGGQLITRNPAARRWGSNGGGVVLDDDDDWLDDDLPRDDDEEAWTTPLGVILLGERLALLTGRDDEFVLAVTKAWMGLRWGEIVGLETRYVGRKALRITWQLKQQNSGELDRIPPKGARRRTPVAPRFLLQLLDAHIKRTKPEPCPCHGATYVFSGGGTARPKLPVSVAQVAERAGVSAATVSNVMRRPERVRPSTRARVVAAMGELGFSQEPRRATRTVPHWKRSEFSATWHAAVDGWWPAKGHRPARPVPVTAEPWPGLPLRGRNAEGRSAACWTPIEPGLTPHGLRHSHKTWMREDRVDEIQQRRRMGHAVSGAPGVYSHVAERMNAELLAHLEQRWHDALEARVNLSPHSRVEVLDELLAPLRRTTMHLVSAPA